MHAICFYNTENRDAVNEMRNSEVFYTFLPKKKINAINTPKL